MSKMRCKCGHIISHVVCPCPTEANVIGHKAYEVIDRGFTKEVSDFLTSVRNGNRSQWIVERFGDVYPKEITDSEVISDLLSCHYTMHSLRLSECETCGRIWIQEGTEENAYRSFVPDEGGYGRHLLIVGNTDSTSEIATNHPMD